MDLYKVNDILKRIVKGNFRIGSYKLTKNILKDEYYCDLKTFLDDYYVSKGYGFKGLIKKFNLDITYTSFRNIAIFLGYEIHSNKEATEALRKQRSDNAKRQYKEKSGFFSDGVQEKIHKKAINRGIQGYYWNASKEKYVWLRSSWEFVYAKWLNKQNVVWDVEICEYRLSDGTLYRPDFFIFEGEKINKVIEIKGFWKNRKYKAELLKKEYGLDTIIIEDVLPYCENNTTLKQEINKWKNLRKLELKK